MLPGEKLLGFVSFLLNILQTFSKFVNKYYLLFEKWLAVRLTSSACGSQAIIANSCFSLGELLCVSFRNTGCCHEVLKKYFPLQTSLTHGCLWLLSQFPSSTTAIATSENVLASLRKSKNLGDFLDEYWNFPL